jgi:hypothetical protein
LLVVVARAAVWLGTIFAFAGILLFALAQHLVDISELGCVTWGNWLAAVFGVNVVRGRAAIVHGER